MVRVAEFLFFVCCGTVRKKKAKKQKTFKIFIRDDFDFLGHPTSVSSLQNIYCYLT